MTSANVANTTVVPAITTVSPYYDDFNEDKGYHRILPRPHRPVQAREITQIQTYAQYQTEKLGRHIFTEGSIVQGGVISYNRAISINLASQYQGTDIVASRFVGKKIGFASGNTDVQLQIISSEETDGVNPPVLFAVSIAGGKIPEGSTIQTNTPGTTNVSANLATSNVYSSCMSAFIPNSIFFIQGFFVKVPEQTIIIDKYNAQPNARVGIEYSLSIVTSDDDPSLLDPALESSNYQAPGADRLKITGKLAYRTLDSTDDTSFIELLRLNNGIKDAYVKIPVYSEIEETFARRTYDESGNYTVRPFNLSLLQSSNSSNLIARLDPGKAYVYGYEHETITPFNLEIPRSLDVSNVSNYDISTSYGNYVVVKDMQGLFDISTTPKVDIHSVSYEQINHANTNTYNSTLIGSARLRNILYDSSTVASNGKTHLHRAYLFDTRFSPLTGNATGGSANTIIMNNPNISSVSDSYKGLYIRLTNGPGAGDITQILSYNGTSKTAYVTGFSSTPTTSTQYSIEGAFKDSESLVIQGVANTNIADSSKIGSDAYLSETGFNRMIFLLPKSNPRPNTGLNNYQYRKIFSSRTFTSGVGSITVSAGEALIGTGTLSETIKLQNYLLVVKDRNGSSLVANGEILSLANTSRSVTVAGSTSTIDLGFSDTIVCDVIADVMINTGTETNPKIKTIISANTTHLTSMTANGTFVSTTGSNTSVFLNSGQVWIRNPNKVPNQEDSLYVSDIKALKKIVDLDGASLTPGTSLSNYTDITNRFVLDTGQYDNYYDHGTIRLKSGVPSPKGPIVVCFDYYQHGSGLSDGKGFFSLDSYPDITTPSGYADVPTYITESGSQISLRDVIDFRPARENASNTEPGFVLNGGRVPTPNEEFTLNFDYYLPRRDLIVLTKERLFKHIKGVSSELPTYPNQITDSMLLYKLELPPYVVNLSDVKINFIENKRYTMRDIGKLEERISHLEYYTTFSLLEKSASEMVIRDSNGLERSKYGIIVDKFTGHQIGDVSNKDYLCSMDLNKGELRAPFEQTDHKLNLVAGNNYAKKSSLITLAYTSSPFITQPKASKTVNLQPYMIAVYHGTATLIPDTDYWVDTEIVPETVTNPVGTRDNWTVISGNTPGNPISVSGSGQYVFTQNGVEFIGSQTTQNPFGTEWSSWLNRWIPESTNQLLQNSLTQNGQGVSLTGTVTSTQAEVNTQQVDPSAITVNLGDSVLDVSVIPFIRSKPVFFRTSGMRPGANVYSFFDGVPVTKYVARANEIVLNGTINFNDISYINEIISSGSNNASLILNSKDVSVDGNTILYVSNTNGVFVSGQTITGSVSGNTATIKEYRHFSGISPSSLGNTANIQLQNTATWDYTGNTIYIVSGPGKGSESTIYAYNTISRIASVSPAFNEAPQSNTVYSIGLPKVNRRGEIAGTFYIPKGQFRVGSRLLTFIDSANNDSRFSSTDATASYLAHGLVQQKSRDIVSVLPPVVQITQPPNNVEIPPFVPSDFSTPESDPRICVGGGFLTQAWDDFGQLAGCSSMDPIAQTFIVDQSFTGGVFIESLDIFFRTKDENIPVRVFIVPTVNGYPSAAKIIPGTLVSLSSDKVNITDSPNIDDPTTYTRFVFDNPVYLQPKVEYAIVVMTDSLEYEAWVAELGQKEINSDRIISEQPYVGSFFRSQNQRTWTPFQYEDLMFRLNRCVFSTNPATIHFNNELPTANKAMDWMYVLTNDMVVNTTKIDYSFKTRPISTQTMETGFTPVTVSQNYRHNNRKVIMTSGESINLMATLSTTSDKVSPVIDTTRLSVLGIKNLINDGGLSNNNITLTNHGYNYSNSSNISITIGGGSTGGTANAYVGAVANGNISSIIVDIPGSYYTGRGNLTFSGGGAINPAEATIASELDATGGPAIARYITRKVTLNDGFDAGDIRVFLTAYRPIGTNISVYCKVLSSDDPGVFETQDYISMVPVTSGNRYSSNDSDYIEYEFRPSGNSNTITYTSSTGTYSTFRTFSIKIVMFSDDTITIPLIKDFRAVALPGTD